MELEEGLMKKKPDSLVKKQELYSAYLDAIEQLRKHCLKTQSDVAIPLPGRDEMSHLAVRSDQRLDRAGYHLGDWVPSDVFYGSSTKE